MDLEEFSKKMTSNLKELKIMADEFKINQVSGGCLSPESLDICRQFL